MHAISHDQKLAVICGGLSEQERRAICAGGGQGDFEEAASRIGLDESTLRRVLIDREALATIRLNPNRVSQSQLEMIPGLPSNQARSVLFGRPYYTISELAAATSLPPRILDQIFAIEPLRFLDKPTGNEVTLVPVPDRYLVPARSEFEEDPITSSGCRELVPATRGFGFRVIQPLDFESAAVLPHELKKAFSGNVHPVLRDMSGFERYAVPGCLDLWFQASVLERRRSSILDELGLAILNSVPRIGYYRTVLRDQPRDGDVIRAVLACITLAQSFDEVRFSEPDYVGFDDFESEPTTSLQHEDFEAADPFWNQEAIKLDEAHAFTRGSSEVVVFVIDSGVRMDHEELAPAFRPDWRELDLNFDFAAPEEATSPDERVTAHGTMVAGVIRQVAPECTVLPLKVSEGTAMPTSVYGLRAAAILQALNYLRDGERAVLNLSWRTNGEHIGIREALREAEAKGALIVTSAGNYLPGERQQPDDIHFPSAHAYLYPWITSLCSVAAVGPSDRKASYSYYGEKSITLTACGGERGGAGFGIYTTSTPEQYVFTQGTSFAAPQVAGVAALLWSKNPAASARDIVRILCESADPLDDLNPTYGGMLGAGRLNAATALRQLTGSQVHRILASAGPHGAIHPEGAVLVEQGADQTFQIAPERGYVISQLLIDGIAVEALTTFTFLQVAEAHSIEVSFVAEESPIESHYDTAGRLNINLATADELCTLPFVGAWRAQRVVQYRETHGPFHSIWGLAQTGVFDAWLIGQLQSMVNI